MLMNINKYSFKFQLKKFKLLFLKKGEKECSELILNKSFKELYFFGYKPFFTFKKSIDKLKPLVLIKPKKVKGIFYDVPYPLSAKTQLNYSLRLMFTRIKLIKQTRHDAAIVSELKDVFHEQSLAVKEVQMLHKTAVQNILFSHFRKKK